ncbi:MAG: large repetitive protein [Phycisphaerales bacterium]|jgi:glucose/arabinose dehydrogenase|nr:large repetitive protein [Phycisphaerales bacterium]
MQSQSSTLMYERKTPRTKQLVIGLIVLALGAFWVIQAVRRGSFMANPSAVTTITSSRPANGEKDVLPNTHIQAWLNAGQAIDPATVDVSTIKLYRTKDKQPVPAQVNTSAAGDVITLTPLGMLEPNTQYTFEVRGVKDLGDAELIPFEMSFTTSAGAPATTYPVGFEKIDLPSDHAYYTGLTIGPDHALYAGTVDGKIIRRQILADGALAPQSQVITSVQAANQGPRLITGIAFDPKSTPQNPKLWVSHGQLILNARGEPSLVGATEWTGKISTVSGPDLAEYRDVVINLPRSWRDHLNNQPAFGPDGCIYWSQGSHTAMGAPTEKWGMNRVERLLSAAVLRLDPSKLSNDQPLDAKTPDGGGTYDPFAKDAPLTLFATGVRLGYEMLWHSNGRLYTAVNGAAEGGRTPGTPANRHANIRRIDSAARGAYDGGDVLQMTITATQPDMLLRLEQGGYYGHPNPIRGEYVLFGGNPTDGVDPYEVTSYPVGTRPDRNWRKPAYSFGTGVSPNGMLEYKSNGKLFGGALDGKILVTRFSGGRDIIVLALDDNGNVTESVSGIAGLNTFTQPLDLAQDPASGCLYIAEYQGERLSMLRPITDESKLADLQQHIFRQQVRASAD